MTHDAPSKFEVSVLATIDTPPWRRREFSSTATGTRDASNSGSAVEQRLPVTVRSDESDETVGLDRATLASVAARTPANQSVDPSPGASHGSQRQSLLAATRSNRPVRGYST